MRQALQNLRAVDDVDYLDAVRIALWKETNALRDDVGNEIVSMSDILWYVRALNDDEFQEDDVLGFSSNEAHEEFQIMEFWKHSDDIPFCKYDLTSFMDALFGTHFAVLGDLKPQQRSPQWIENAYVRVESLRRTAYYLATRVLTDGVLNSQEYRRPASLGSKKSSFRRKEIHSDASSGEELDIEEPEGERPSRTNVAFWYDCNAMFMDLDRGLLLHDSLLISRVKERVPVERLRQHVYELAATMRDNDVMEVRHQWEHSLKLNEADVRIYCRKFPNNPTSLARTILTAKHMYLADDVPKNKDEALRLDVSKRDVTTDAMFRMVAQQKRYESGQDVFQHFYVENWHDRGSVGPKIFRDRVSNEWLCWFADGETCYALKGFTQAFIHMRKLMNERGMPATVTDEFGDAVNLGYFDDFFAEYVAKPTTQIEEEEE